MQLEMKPATSVTEVLEPDVAKSVGGLEGLALRSSRWMEKWFPDAFVVVLVAIVVVAIMALVIGAKPTSVISSFGDGFWSLLPFSMQMALVVVTGCALATATPVLRVIDSLARVPSSSRSAVAFVALISMVVSLLNWAFGLIFAGLLVRALGRREDLDVDFRAATAAAYLSIGGPCLLGLSSAPALLHATPASVPKSLYGVTGYISLADTLFTWQNAVAIVVMTITGIAVAYATAPRAGNAVTARKLKIDLVDKIESSSSTRPGDWLENSPLLTILLGLLMGGWLALKFATIGFFATISNLNNYIFLVLTLALVLHWRPGNFMRSAAKATPSVAGIIVQFPLYAGVAAILVQAKNSAGLSLSHYLSEFFVGLSGEHGFPLVVGIYSVIMGIFIPSAGGKWMLEAPYLMTAAVELKSSLAWVIQTYSGAETLANLINPFWMLPLLGMVALKAKHIIGFTFIYFLVMAPITITVLWLLGLSMEYRPPVFP